MNNEDKISSLLYNKFSTHVTDSILALKEAGFIDDPLELAAMVGDRTLTMQMYNCAGLKWELKISKSEAK